MKQTSKIFYFSNVECGIGGLINLRQLSKNKTKTAISIGLYYTKLSNGKTSKFPELLRWHSGEQKSKFLKQILHFNERNHII